MFLRPRIPAVLLTLLLAVAACDAAVVSPSPSETPGATPSPTVPATPSPATSASPSGGPSASGSAAASASPGASQDLTAIYEAVNEQVQEIRGLEEREPVEAQIVSSDELGDILAKAVREDTPPDLLATYERLYQAMGLMPDDASLSDVYVDLLESQVGGLYDPTTESLYVLSKEGDVGVVERMLYAHEYQHALQDQHFDLEALQPADLVDDSDRQLARQALVEGDAYVGMTYWLQQHLSPVEMLEVLELGNDPEATAALEDIPPIVSGQILFPAINGLTWVLGIQQAGGWEAVDAAFAEPPESSEQILHPEKWATREAPIAVELPEDLAERLGDGWKVALEDTMGEFQIGIWLGAEISLSPFQPPPPAAAVGWGGDRIALLEGPDDAWAVVWRTAWDSESEAEEFLGAATEALDTADGPGQSFASDRDVWLIVGSSEDVLGLAAEAAGQTGG